MRGELLRVSNPWSVVGEFFQDTLLGKGILYLPISHFPLIHFPFLTYPFITKSLQLSLFYLGSLYFRVGT